MIKTPLSPVYIAPPQEKTKKGAAIQLIASTLYPEPQLKILNPLKWHSIENPLILLIIY